MLIRAMLVAAVVTAAMPAAAQTANDVNRLNAAIQICNSPMGAGTPECAKLRGQLGGGGGGVGALGLGGGTAGKAAGIASLLGGAMASRPAAAPAPSSIGIDLNKAISSCVARAAGDQAQIQRCLAIANGGAPAPR